MPEEIFGWSETRNLRRALSAYGNNTRQMQRMIKLHPTEVEDMYTVQIVIMPRGSSGRNGNEDREDTWKM